jgi:uncharacterized protein YhaN
METRNENTKKSSKKQFFLGFAVAAFTLAAIVGVTGLYKYFYQKPIAEENLLLSEENMALNQKLEEQEVSFQEIMTTFDEIEYNLDIITHNEQLLKNTSVSEPELSNNVREDIVTNIQFINTLLEESQNQIADLKHQLKSLSKDLASFRTKAARLSEVLKEKEADLTALISQLEQSQFAEAELTQQMDTLSATIKRQEAVIESIDRELNTAYVTTGTYANLNQRGIVDKEGGILWMGRTKTVEETAPQNEFAEVDIRNFKKVVVDAKKVELITEHPENSYEIEEEENGQIASINIKNPEEFWRLSNYLVVEVR